MTVSKVMICNLALSAIGDKSRIQSLSEASPQAAECNLHYDQCLRLVLEDVDWSFCSVTATSALLAATPPDDWTYMYAEPANSVKVREIVNALGRVRDPIPFARHYYATNAQRVLLTDFEDPTWRYTRYIDDPIIYSTKFVECLSYMIASKISMALTRKGELSEAMSKMYLRSKMEAAVTDGNEIHQNGEEPRAVEWIEARGRVRNYWTKDYA